MSSDGSNTLSKNRPDFNKSIPRNSNIIVVLWVLTSSEFADSISMSWIRRLSLDLTLIVPNGTLEIKSSRVNNFGINRNATGIDILLSTKEGLFKTSINNTPKSHRVIPRRTEEDLIVLTETQVTNEVVMTSQSILWNSDLAKIVSSIVINVPDEDFLVSSSSDKESSIRVFDTNTSRDDTRDLSLVAFNKLLR